MYLFLSLFLLSLRLVSALPSPASVTVPAALASPTSITVQTYVDTPKHGTD